MNPRSSNVEFPAGSQPGFGFQCLSETPTSQPWLFVFHEFLGLTEYIRSEANEWQQELGANVLAIHLYDGKVGASREEGLALVSSVDPVRLTEIVNGALDYIGRDRPVAMLGWCFGGAWALRASIIAQAQSTSTVMYYGMPVFDEAELRKLAGPVIEIFGSHDQHINADVKQRFEHAMTQADRDLKTYTFEAGHAFANPSNPHHDIDATAEAKSIVLRFLKETLLA